MNFSNDRKYLILFQMAATKASVWKKKIIIVEKNRLGLRIWKLWRRHQQRLGLGALSLGRPHVVSSMTTKQLLGWKYSDIILPEGRETNGATAKIKYGQTALQYVENRTVITQQRNGTIMTIIRISTLWIIWDDSLIERSADQGKLIASTEINWFQFEQLKKQISQIWYRHFALSPLPCKYSN